MGRVILDMAMSLDGFISAPDGGDGTLHDWYFAPAPPSAAVIDELVKGLGVIIMGRRTYGMSEENDGVDDSPYDAVNLVITHHVFEKEKASEKVIFVTDGIESAFRQAQAAAGDRDIAIGGGADIAQQFLKAGLVDELQIHVVPILLGGGLRLFETLQDTQIELEITRVVESVGVTHLKYRVVK